MKSTQKKVSGADLPTPLHGFTFEMKAWVKRMARGLANKLHPVPKHKPLQALEQARVLSESVSLLWSGEDTAAMLVAGKIQNLRLASRRLDGVVVPAGEIFSFWKQAGRMTRRRGYARGRELREGCIIPTIGGGICQLSNAIYDAALKAGLEVVERHRHSQVIAGSLAEQGRDATVFWNYLDLRLRAPFAWQLQVCMDEKQLYARILAQGCPEAPVREGEGKQLPPDAMGDCSRCGRTDCYLHTGDMPLLQHKAWLVTDEEWPEFAHYRRLNRLEGDKVVASSGYFFTNACSRLLRRMHLWLRHPLPVAQNSRYSRIARAMRKQLDASDTCLVIPQDLLPWLQMAGELRGRQYDVFMNALPVGELQNRLDIAAALHPHIRPLNNFRADAGFLRAEAEALAAARHWITPHAGIIGLGGRKAVPLAWQMPDASPRPVSTGDSGKQVLKVLLAAPSLARKGAYELAAALRTLPKPVQLLLLPGKPEAPGIWAGLETKRCASVAEGIREADVAVLPAWVEHQPRIALRAIASGKPLIATPACGLPAHLPWTPVAAGDTQGLREAILSVES